MPGTSDSLLHSLTKHLNHQREKHALNILNLNNFFSDKQDVLYLM